VKTLETDDSRVELLAVTRPDYGRIFAERLPDVAAPLIHAPLARRAALDRVRPWR
jgi:hypothetical protein